VKFLTRVLKAVAFICGCLAVSWFIMQGVDAMYILIGGWGTAALVIVVLAVGYGVLMGGEEEVGHDREG
jgi:hypothetical protein